MYEPTAGIGGVEINLHNEVSSEGHSKTIHVNVIGHYDETKELARKANEVMDILLEQSEE